MPELPLFNVEGKNVGQVAAADDFFGKPMNEHVVYETLRWFQASQRRGTQSAKTRAEVRGGGVKPWKQKGTGRARAGSIRSPLWRKGGVIFAPKPRDYGYALPKKVRKLALKIVLSDKAKEGRIKVVEEIKITEPKTKSAVKIMKGLGVSGKVLCMLAKENQDFEKAARNIAGVKFSLLSELNVFDLLNADWILTDKSTISLMEGK